MFTFEDFVLGAAWKWTRAKKEEGGSKLGNLEQTYFLNDPQIISLKKMVVLSIKLTILLMVSYLYSFNPFIIINEIVVPQL